MVAGTAVEARMKEEIVVAESADQDRLRLVQAIVLSTPGRHTAGLVRCLANSEIEIVFADMHSILQ